MPETEPNLEETIERVRRMLAHHRWLIIATASVLTLATVAALSYIPNRYRSEATLILTQQQVSQRFVEPDSTSSPSETVMRLTAEVLSRSKLLAVADEFGLYRKERASLAPEDVVEVMRKDLDVEPTEAAGGRLDYSVFKIAFTAPTAQMAHDVATRLTGLFIEGNTKSRGREATATTNFLADRVEAARRRVMGQEERLREFKSANLGELPEQQATNLGVLTDLRTQLNNVASNVSRVQQQRQGLEQQRIALIASVTSTLTKLQTDRAALLKQFTPRYPDVQAKDQEIAKTEALLERLKSPNLSAGASGSTPDDLAAAQLKTQMDSSAAELESLGRQQAKIQGEIDQVQRRLNLTPIRDQQLKEILRDYDLYNKEYTDLQSKQMQSQLAANVEERQEGQQFRLVEPPTNPLKPVSPKRHRILAGGFVAGVILGLALAFLLDRRDSSFFSEKAVKREFQIPIVLGVPMLRTDREERNRKLRMAFEWAAAVVILAAVCAAGYYFTEAQRPPTSVMAATSFSEK